MRGGRIKKMPKESKENLKKYEELKKTLEEQLITQDNYNKITMELLEKYIKFTKIEDKLNEDIEDRGVSIAWNNGGGQKGRKKNDSIAEFTRVDAQKLKILDKLGIKAPESKDEGDGEYEV